MLELTEEARERIYALQELADKVGADPDDRAARTELRRALRESSPAVVARLSDTTRNYRRIIAQTASGGNPLVEEAISEQASRMAREIAGEAPTPLDVLLSERIASLWVLVELQEALGAAWYVRNRKGRATPAFMLQMVKLQEASNRRYLAAIKTLAQVRKLQANTPGVQFNTQINVGTAPNP